MEKASFALKCDSILMPRNTHLPPCPSTSICLPQSTHLLWNISSHSLCLKIKKEIALRYNSHATEFIHFKYIHLNVFYIHKNVQPSPVTLEHFHYPERNFYLSAVTLLSLFPPHTPSSAVRHQLSVSLKLPILNISYKLNHIMVSHD